jgi:fluoride ion exporter CrcB/FEX
MKKIEKMVDPILLNELILPAVLGGVGGLTRGFIGLLKALSLRRRILWGYYTITVVVAVVIGIFVGLIFNFDYRLSLLAGYAGTDILEGIYKSFQTQKVYVRKGK